MIHSILILSVLYCIPKYIYIYFFKHCYHYNIYDVILISLHHTTGPSRWLFFVIWNRFVFRKTGKTATIHGCFFDYITYSSNNTSERCVFVIYIHKVKCTILISILLQFGLSHQYNIQANTGWLFYSPTIC